MIITDRDKILQTNGTGADRAAVPVRKREAESLEHSGSAVVGGTATDSDDEAPATSFYSIQDHFPDPEGRGEKRIAFGRWHKSDACGSGHFNNGGLCFFDQTITAGDRAA